MSISSKLPAVAAASDPSAPAFPNNPLVTLLDDGRQQQFASFSPEEQNAFYGRVMSSVFSSDAYQKLAFDTAASEFDKIAAARKSGAKN